MTTKHTVGIDIGKTAFNGMLRDEMEFRSAALENDSTASRGQATFRRILREHASDRTLTPGLGDRIDSVGSVFAPGVSPVRNIRFPGLTSTESNILPLHFSDEGEGRRTPEDLGLREHAERSVEYPISREDLRNKSSEQYVEIEDGKEDQQQEGIEPTYPPGIFRYIPSDFQLAQEKEVRTAHAAKSSSRGFSSSVGSPKSSFSRQQSDWARIRQEYEEMAPYRNELAGCDVPMAREDGGNRVSPSGFPKSCISIRVSGAI